MLAGMALKDWANGAKERRLRRDAQHLEATFTSNDRSAQDYGRVLRAALQLDPPLARRLFDALDRRIPDERYRVAFPDPGWLDGLVPQGDRNVLTVVFEIATRLYLPSAQGAARSRLVGLLARERDADVLLTYLRRWLDLAVLDRDTLGRVLAQVPLRADPAPWSAFFAQVPLALQPDLCEVHLLLGRGADAVRLADTADRQRAALDCCVGSSRLDDLAAGLELARRGREPAMVRRLEERTGEILAEQGLHREALPHFVAAGRTDRVCDCHESLGEYFEALGACPADQPERAARLVAACQPAVDALVERREFTEALRHSGTLVDKGGPVGLREAVLAAGRAHFRQRDDSAEWSRFEEEAGEWSAAARLAEEAGDTYRAYRLYRGGDEFGEADRVLRGDTTVRGVTARAEAREAGDDLAGAARLYEQAGDWEQAVDLYMRGRDFGAAARVLVTARGDAVLADPRYAESLRRSGDLEDLVRRCLDAVARDGAGTDAGVRAELRRLADDPAVPAGRRTELRSVLETLDGQARGPFEERAQAWVRQARAEIDARFSGIWGMDLGTTTCAAAIYDSETREVVLCPWKGHDQFASTLSLDNQGNELVGLDGEEIFASWLVGHIGAAKRRIGSRTKYRIKDRTYRPEEVAARLIGHARDLVETFLAARVRERLAQLAGTQLKEVRDEWLAWAEQHHDLRLERPRVVLTIPAFFLNNQKHATRDACGIAGVEVVRLIHEPTAACMSAARDRHLTGRVVVVDLGAGTLDVSFLEVDETVYEVQKVMGDNHFGGKDLDAVVSAALVRRLEEQGTPVPAAGVPRRRLEIAAENLKVRLSGQSQADYVLRSFVDGQDVRLELDRDELAGILAEPLGTLRGACTEFRSALDGAPDHLVLVGGPMLSPLVCETVEQVFGVRRTVLPDPRTAVACGAALQAAVLDGKLHEQVLLDVTPLPLGVRVLDAELNETLSVLVEPNTRIPVERRSTFTTTTDDQTAVDIIIYNGQLESSSKIGQFRLDNIPLGPSGTPEIEVTFAIDPSCVLEVTAKELSSGHSNSIKVSDTTLLSPREVEEMARRHREQQDRQEASQRLGALVNEVNECDVEAPWREFRNRLDTYRPTSAPLDAETQRLLADMYRGANQMEVDLLLAAGPLGDLAANALEHLSMDEPGDHTAHLAAQLDRQLALLRSLLTELARWNAVLIRLAVAEPDPLRRFRGLHDAGAYHRALDTAATLDLDDPDDVRRLLHCLAETGDADAYGVELARHGLSRDPTDLALVRPALADVGFLVTDTLVATTRRTVDSVEVAGAPRAVAETVLPASPLVNLALLRLAEAVSPEPLRLGHPKLVRVGDTVWAFDGSTMVSGLVNRFESFPEEGFQVFKTGLSLPPSCAGGPLLNAFGEAVGVLTVRVGAEGAYAITVDALPMP